MGSKSEAHIMEQLHKKFTNSQVKVLIKRYSKKKVAIKYIQLILDIKKTRFFTLIRRLKDNPENFYILYSRRIPTRKIDPDIEKNIVIRTKDRKGFNQSKRM